MYSCCFYLAVIFLKLIKTSKSIISKEQVTNNSTLTRTKKSFDLEKYFQNEDFEKNKQDSECNPNLKNKNLPIVSISNIS